MADKLKIVMIGAGGRANDVIYPSFADLSAQGLVEFVGICDIDPERLHTTADKYNIQNRYGDNRYVYEYQKMIEEQKPDAAVVIGQPHIMYDIWMWCLSHGLHLYVEKPLALSIHQARALEAVARRNNLVTQVSLQRRHCPMIVQLHEKVREHGEVTHAVCKFYKCNQDDFLGARDHMMDDTVHAIDTLRWMVGSEIKSIDSVCRRVGTVDINYIMAQMTFENGAVGHLMNNWSSGKRIFAVEMHAPGVFVEAEHETKGYLYENGSTTPTVYDCAESAGSDETYAKSGVLQAAKDFTLACLGKAVVPQCNFTDNLRTMKIAETILAQALLAEGV
ncbi:MAG: Gfo/Idh/MocA family oxidoreductase [Oscillospiraceae bacterium]|jgi:predicted dehydrogenase|nr:Gfo/Idh/MocA family oxidoreductase [Oscillospiraceae bacterium]